MMSISYFGLLFLGSVAIFFLVVAAKLLSYLFTSKPGQVAPVAHATAQRGNGSFGTAVSIMLGLGLVLGVLALPAIFWARSSHQTVNVAMHRNGVARAAVDATYQSTPAELPAVEGPMPEESATDLVAEKADLDLMALPKLPADAPTWAKGPNVVKSQPSASKKSARKQALAQATEMLMRHYSEANRGVGKWRADIEKLDRNVVTREYTGEVPWNLTAGTDFKSKELLPDTAYITCMQVNPGPEANAAIYRQWKQEVSGGRLESVTFVFGGLTAAIALFATYLRIEKRGFLRRTVRFASLMTAVGLGVGSTIAGAEAFSQSNHGYNSNGHLQQAPEIEEQPTATRVSQFAGIPLSGHRIGFVILGDERFRESDKVDRVCNEIVGCISGFDQGAYRVFCESNLITRQTGGNMSQSGIAEQRSAIAIKRAMETCFLARSKSTFPRNTVRTVQYFSPDEMVVIGDGDANLAGGPGFPHNSLGNLLETLNVPVHAVELSMPSRTAAGEERSKGQAAMKRVAIQTGGAYVLWDGTRP